MSEGQLGRLLEGVRRHERFVALVWLVAAGLVLVSVALGPIRARVLGGTQNGADWWEGRWLARLQVAERLVAESSWDEAVARLERLDRLHPARSVKHARDKERERVLRLLAQSYEALDRRAQTIQTYRRLVDFDPNHYRNPFDLAQALDRLRGRGTTPAEARDAYAAALDLFPAHLPSVRGYAAYYLDRSESREVTASYERYLDAYLVQHVRVGVGDVTSDLPVLVDGRFRDYELAIANSWSAGDVLRIATGGFAGALQTVEVLPAIRVGRVPEHDAVPVDVAEARTVEFELAGRGTYRPSGPGSALILPIPDWVRAVRGVRLRLALFKPVDRELWTAVSRS